MASRQSYTYKRITTGTTLIKNGPGTLGGLSVNKALTGTVTITDGVNTIAVLTNGTTAPLGTVMFGGPDGGTQFGQQLQIVLSATEDITVFYI